MADSALAIELVSIDRVFLSPSNPRHNDEAVPHVAASLRRFGFQQPIVAKRNGEVIAGNTRLKAAKSLGITQLPVVWFDGTDLDATAYQIADNRTHEFSAWDDGALAKLLEELRVEDALEGVGYSDADLDALLAELEAQAAKNRELDDPGSIEPPDTATTRRGDLWLLGKHRLLCGDSSLPADLDRLLAGARIQLVNTDPPYNVKVEPRSNNAIAAGLSSFQGTTHHQKLDVERHPDKAQPTTRKLRAKDRPLANDFLSDTEFDRLLLAWFGNIARVLEPGRAFYIWGGYANCSNYPPALKACELYFSQSIIWDKQHPVLTRKDFMGAHEWCQPAETLVLTPDGHVSIASLRDGDRVSSFRRSDSLLTGRRDGIEVRRTERPYSGRMLTIRAGRKETRCTTAHIWSVRLAPESAHYWCVYLMRRGRWWRIGKSKFVSTAGFGVKHRLVTERGEQAWILSTHTTNLDATIHEQVCQARYGIPTTTWNETYASRRALIDVGRLYEQLDLDLLDAGARRALADHGREFDHPFLDRRDGHRKVGSRVAMTIRACNLLPGLMLVPVPQHDRVGTVPWVPLDEVASERFEGLVHSLDVPGLRHYVADGIVTHNCFYGWREGAAHQYYGPANATDLWAVKKVNPQSMVHLTEKPVELAVRAIEYSSKPGENVLDLFGGSGSTLIAAEQTARRAHLMEMDELYCDVILMRWQQATGEKALLEGTGESFDELRAARGATP